MLLIISVFILAVAVYLNSATLYTFMPQTQLEEKSVLAPAVTICGPNLNISGIHLDWSDLTQKQAGMDLKNLYTIKKVEKRGQACLQFAFNNCHYHFD